MLPHLLKLLRDFMIMVHSFVELKSKALNFCTKGILIQLYVQPYLPARCTFLQMLDFSSEASCLVPSLNQSSFFLFQILPRNSLCISKANIALSQHQLLLLSKKTRRKVCHQAHQRQRVRHQIAVYNHVTLRIMFQLYFKHFASSRGRQISFALKKTPSRTSICDAKISNHSQAGT